MMGQCDCVVGLVLKTENFDHFYPYLDITTIRFPPLVFVPV